MSCVQAAADMAAADARPTTYIRASLFLFATGKKLSSYLKETVFPPTTSKGFGKISYDIYKLDIKPDWT